MQIKITFNNHSITENAESFYILIFRTLPGHSGWVSVLKETWILGDISNRKVTDNDNDDGYLVDTPKVITNSMIVTGD